MTGGDRWRVLLGIHEPYTNERVEVALRAHGFHQITPYESSNTMDANLDAPLWLWLEYEDLPWERLLSPNSSRTLVANSYCIRKGLIRKAQFAYHTQKYLSKNPQSILSRTVPETYIMELDHPDYLDEALNELYEVAQELQKNAEIPEDRRAERKKFIMKPSITNKAHGIFLFDTEEMLRAYVEEMQERYEEEVDAVEEDEDDNGAADLHHIREWVVQSYIDRPLLLSRFDHRKFHIRAYVLAVGNLEVYLCDRMLALFSMETYLDANGDPSPDLRNLPAHLTNTCVQADRPDFQESASVYLMDEIFAYEPAERYHKVLRDMKAVLHDVFDAVSNEVTSFQPRPNCFELYGMDFLLDQEWNVHFLEANAFPDFKQTGEKCSAVVETLFHDTVAVVSQVLIHKEPAPADVHGSLHNVFTRRLPQRPEEETQRGAT